nr:hypothetical protein BaRGS_021524 [Batillaria attramentaria]
MFAVMRVLIGVTVGGILATYFGYPAEFVGIKWRALLGSACSLSYYGLSFGIKNLAGDFYLNLFLMAVVEVPPTFFIHPLFSCSFAIVPVHFFGEYGMVE